MKKIVFVTNMEPHKVGMLEAVNSADIAEITKLFEVIQVNDSELWTDRWQKLINDSAFVLFTWMGTGLSCDFLKKASVYMQQRKITHLFNILDPGDDLLEYGIEADCKESIQQYFACGGLQNYKNLCLWLSACFCGFEVKYEQPQQLPWNGIYHPESKNIFTSLSEYRKQHYSADKPTVGFIFAREDWLWNKLAYEEAVIRAVEHHDCNIIAVFTTTMGNAQTGAVKLSDSLQQYFYEADKSVIDVLINPFVFSLTVTGFLELQDIQSLGVPVLQVYNVYMDFKWWEKNMVGLTANEVSYAVAMPEFDGIIHSVPVSTNEERADGTHYRKPLFERIDTLARKAKKWALLRHKDNKDKKIAIVFHNYPPTNSNIGSAACLDSIESIRLMLEKMQKQGYKVDRIPGSNQEFIEDITAHATNDRRFISEQLLREADGKLTETDYKKFFDSLPCKTQKQMMRDWGEAPGDVFRYEDVLIVPGMLNGNIFITVQPPRGFGDDPGKIYHSPDCAPTHHYVGFYHWVRNVWGADAMMHVGTHGNLEWLPGKGNAMSNACYSRRYTQRLSILDHLCRRRHPGKKAQRGMSYKLSVRTYEYFGNI